MASREPPVVRAGRIHRPEPRPADGGPDAPWPGRGGDPDAWHPEAHDAHDWPDAGAAPARDWDRFDPEYADAGDPEEDDYGAWQTYGYDDGGPPDHSDFLPDHDDPAAGGAVPRGRLSRFVSLLGALTSVALIGGLAYWGWSLAMRDVRGIPVIRALEGPARVAPLSPGGELADHTGLAVNQIAAEGAAAPVADQLKLAPKPVELTADDMAGPAVIAPAPPASETDLAAPAPASLPVPDMRAAPSLAAPEAPAEAPATETAAAPATAPDGTAAALALAEQLAADALAEGGAPLSGAPAPAPDAAAPAPSAVDAAVAEALQESLAAPSDAAAPVVPATVPGVARSPRPVARPAALATTAAAPATAAETAAAAPAATPGAATEIDAASLPKGTRLVQIGAFDTPEDARGEWDRVAAQFGALFSGKSRVIESAVSGGRTFYRLRVSGFADVEDTRRFCAALLAEQTNCIPAQVR